MPARSTELRPPSVPCDRSGKEYPRARPTTQAQRESASASRTLPLGRGETLVRAESETSRRLQVRSPGTGRTLLRRLSLPRATRRRRGRWRDARRGSRDCRRSRANRTSQSARVSRLPSVERRYLQQHRRRAHSCWRCSMAASAALRPNPLPVRPLRSRRGEGNSTHVPSRRARGVDWQRPRSLRPAQLPSALQISSCITRSAQAR